MSAGNAAGDEPDEATLDTATVSSSTTSRRCSTYSMYLEGDYEVRTAANGGEALVELGPDIDVILLDRRMPGCPATRSSNTSGTGIRSAGW